MSDSTLLLPQVVLPPRYQLRSVLKQTEESCVFRVFDVSQGRDEAIKILCHALDDPQALLRFRTEFSTLASLEHASVIKVFDYGVLQDRYPFFTMEYFVGKKINEYFDGRNWPALYDVILQIASGLHHIHHLGIVHLDLKPSNILVSDDGRAKLMDFGLAIESRQVLDRRIRGTLQYMAPEVLRQDRVDSRADLYALGMTLYETVTGALPGYGRPTIEVIRMHLDEEVRPPTSINPRVPPALGAIIVKLLEKDPRHRFQSAAALLQAVAAAAGKGDPTAELLVGRGELFAAPLIGRRGEIDQLTDLIGEAREGRGTGVVLAGPEGVGKSRIVRDVTLRAQLDGARVFSGRCPVNRKTIYAPFFEIFQQMLLAVNPEADVGEEIRRLLRPVVVSSSPETRSPQQGQKYRMYNRVVQSMQDLYGFLSVGAETAGSPLILVVEDLQWADPSTIELFTFLIGEARHNRLLVIGTVTLETGGEAALESATPSIAFWEQRARETGFPIIRVETLPEPLVREHVQALLGESEIPEEFGRWMLWESAGSPLAIRRIVDYLIAHEYLTWQPSGWSIDLDRLRTLRIPGGPGSILMEKVDGLSPERRELLEIAAVVGEVTELGLLTQVSTLEPEALYGATHDLAKEGLIDESGDGRTISFPQLNLRVAIYNTIPDRRRAELHLRVAEALEPAANEGSSQLLGQVAWHFSRANDIERGIRYSIAAGDIASDTLAHEGATEFYRVALELMDLGGVEEARKAEVREKLADAYYRRDDYRSAIHAYQFLLKSIQARNPGDEANPDVARVMKKIGKVLARRGDHDAAMTHYQGSLAIYERLGQTIDVAEMYNRLAWLHRVRDDLDAACETAERALELLNDGSRPTVVLGYVKNILGLIEFARGDWRKSRGLLEEALAIGRALESEQLCKVASTNLGNTVWKLGEWDAALSQFRENLERSESEGDLWDLVTAYNNVGVVEYGRGNFQTAVELFEKSVRIDEKIGAIEHEALARENLADALEMLGRWDEALEHYRRCTSLEGFDETRSSRLSVYVPFARLMRKRGDLGRAHEYAQKALAAGERARHEDLIAKASYVIATIEDERGHPEEAEKHLARAIAIFEDHHTLQGVARARTAAATVALQRGRVEEAVAHATIAEDLARRLGDRFALAQTDWAWGKIHGSKGEREAASARFEAARAAFEELDTPYELGRLLFDVGLLREEPEEATETIRGAVRVFERLNATRDLERARGALFRIRPAGKAPEQGVVGLYEIVKIVNSTLDLEEVLNRVLDVCVKRLRAERGMIILLDPLTGALRTRVVRNIKDGETESKRSPQSIVKDVIQTGRPVMSADARADARFVDSESVIAENILSILCAPLIIKERIAGAIYVDHRQARHLFSQKDLSFLEAFADQAAIAIENARLYEELEEARTRLSLENETLRREVLVEKHLDSIVGQSEVVARTQFAIRKASAGHSTVLVRGESGTGKGLVARIIHNIGPRRNGPFIKFNCAALPETLAESELFGHEKGAFTGADRRKLGRFELANNGTIFLDEIGKLSLAMQAKLLRVVEDKEFERVGGTQTIKTDVKIITATNLDLEKAIEEGTFREDLFYRLNIIPIMLPPLRDRKDDIPLLAEHFIRKICKDLGIDNKRLEAGVLDLFMQYDWPGNVRELEATLHRAIVMANDEIVSKKEFYNLYGSRAPALVAADPTLGMPAAIVNPLAGRTEITSEVYDEVLSAVDKQMIIRALESAGGRIREAARRLGLARNTLKAKMQKYDLSARD